MCPVIAARRWPRRLWFLRRRRRPIVRLWDRDFNYVSTLCDGGRETWGQWARRLLLATPSLSRQVIEISRGTLTVDADVI